MLHFRSAPSPAEKSNDAACFQLDVDFGGVEKRVVHSDLVSLSAVRVGGPWSAERLRAGRVNGKSDGVFLPATDAENRLGSANGLFNHVLQTLFLRPLREPQILQHLAEGCVMFRPHPAILADNSFASVLLYSRVCQIDQSFGSKNTANAFVALPFGRKRFSKGSHCWFVLKLHFQMALHMWAA